MPVKNDLLVRYGIYPLLAFLGALILWYTVNAGERTERIIEIELAYQNIPEGLVVTSGQMPSVRMRIRAPRELLRSLGNRTLTHAINLSGLHPGDNVVPLTFSDFRSLRYYEVLEIIPARLDLHVERIREKEVPVRATVQTSPHMASFVLKDTSVIPDKIRISGPSGVIEDVDSLLVSVPAGFDLGSRDIDENLPVSAPSSVKITPPFVHVKGKIEMRRRIVTLQRDVILESESDVLVRPSKVTLSVSVPLTALKDSLYLSQVQVSVSLDGLSREEIAKGVPLQTITPLGCKVLKIIPEKAEILPRAK
ncbi:MAG: hypothetical protein PUB69_06005 [Desulfovibrionaceae bacterium]|nr:hypothetical protein [Desulfovibrionaceae bacterium]